MVYDDFVKVGEGADGRVSTIFDQKTRVLLHFDFSLFILQKENFPGKNLIFPIHPIYPPPGLSQRSRPSLSTSRILGCVLGNHSHLTS